jgi:hypothetical protein
MAHPEHGATSLTPGAGESLPSRSRRWSIPSSMKKAVAPALIVLLCLLHGLAIWTSLGGRAGLTNGWPLWRDDHPLYFHSALVTRAFLKDSYTTAGYDPSFMSGYAKSVVFPASSTLPELVIAAFGGTRPEFAYKLYVLVSAAAVPWLIALACFIWQIRAATAATAVGLALVYIWTDFPLSYAAFGMLPYFLGIPLGLVATGVFARYLIRGGWLNGIMASMLMSLAVLVHLTTAIVIAPAALLAYIVACGPESRSERPWTRMRHVGVWLIPVVVLAVNAFWWLPGMWLSSTKGPSDFAFNHPEGVISRLAKIIGGPEAPIQCILLATGLPGLAWMIRRRRIDGAALLGFCAAGLFWGYLAGGLRALDFLQPGRHTYALYTGLALAGALGIEELARRLHAGSPDADHFHRWVMVGAVLIGFRMVGSPILESIRSLGSAGEPFLSSRPSHRLVWVIERVRRHVKPGERLLYEEGGKDLPGVPDPFQRGRFSGLLPDRTGVEVLGGPYLHASLTTNFTQFGEGMLFGRAGWYRILMEELPKLDLAQIEKVFGRRDRLLLEELRRLDPGVARTIRSPHGGMEEFLDKVRKFDPASAAKVFGRSGWDRDFFIRYARLYRPSAILCWSPDARWFCRANPDLIQIKEDDGTLLIGRVVGFGGDTIRGGAKVEAEGGRIHVREMSPGLDGTVVLRYHSVPCLTTKPSVACEPEYLEEDPVPFLRLRPPAGTRDVELELVLPRRP